MELFLSSATLDRPWLIPILIITRYFIPYDDRGTRIILLLQYITNVITRTPCDSSFTLSYLSDILTPIHPNIFIIQSLSFLSPLQHLVAIHLTLSLPSFPSHKLLKRRPGRSHDSDAWYRRLSTWWSSLPTLIFGPSDMLNQWMLLCYHHKPEILMCEWSHIVFLYQPPWPSMIESSAKYGSESSALWGSYFISF